MALVSLKRTEHAEAEEYKAPAYGYGTEIYLDGEQVEALGITDLVRAGQSVMIRAVGVVKRTTEELESSDDSGGKDMSLCIQLTDIEVEMQGKADPAKAATLLYADMA